MKAKIRNGENPWKSAWDRWLAEPVSSLDFKPKAFAHIVRGAFGAGQIGGAQLSTSAAAVSSHVLQWYVTGEEAHARKVIEIFDARSSTLADFSENDAMLLAGWTGGEFVNAAEILRASYPAWPAASREQFKRMLLTVYVPLLRMYYPEANGNWDGAMMFTLLAIGIFCEDRGLMDAVYDHYRTGPVNSGITRYVYPSGQCGRDLPRLRHVQLGLGYFAQTAIVAWNQGVDLFQKQTTASLLVTSTRRATCWAKMFRLMAIFHLFSAAVSPMYTKAFCSTSAMSNTSRCLTRNKPLLVPLSARTI